MSSPSSPSPDLDSERLHYLRSPICTIKPSFPWGQTPRKGERWFYAQRQDVSFSRKVAVHSCPPPPPRHPGPLSAYVGPREAPAVWGSAYTT